MARRTRTLPSLTSKFLATALAAAFAMSAHAQTATVGGNWTQQSPATSPSARNSAPMAYNAANGTVVLFGGLASGFTKLADTWTYNGTTWTQQSPATSPSARYGSTMAYDAATGTMVLFGGIGSSYLADTWTYNGTTWTKQSPATSPPAREDATMAYDAATGTVVLFGGYNGTAYLSDIWTYNGTTWTQQSPATSPSGRDNSTMAYDAATGTIVLFGGFDGNYYLADTWTYNGTTWTQQSPAISPSGRENSAMAYDLATGTVLLFGGTGNSGYLGDTWTYNGTTWTQQSPATSPSTRSGSTIAYNVTTGNAVLFGGSGSSGYLGDTWTYTAGVYVAPTSNVGTAAAQTTVTFTIGTAGTLPALSNSNVLTTGTAGLDFTLGTGSTCSGTVTAGQTCKVNVAFSPSAPGLRSGAVKLLNSSGTVLATATITGTGTGPLALLQPGTLQTTISTALNLGRSPFVDAAGNVYVADQSNSRVLKYPAGSTTATTLATVSSSPQGLAVDGSGNVFFAASGGTAPGLYEVVGGTGTAQRINSTLTNLDDNLSVDAAGNLYASDAQTGAIYQLPYGDYAASTTLIAGGAGRRFMGVALDGKGNLFAADTQGSVLYELVSGATTLTAVTSSLLSAPSGMAIDPAGNIYVSNSNAGAGIVRFAAGNYAATPVTLPSTAQYGLTLGGDGSIYAITSNSTLVRYSRASATLGFPSTPVGTTATSQTVTLENDGNSALSISVPTSGINPAIVGPYALGSSGTCPQISSAGTAQTLASGTTCTDVITFYPTAVSATNSGTLTTSDNSRNTASTQVLTLSGISTQGPQTITFPQPATPAQAGTSATLAATASSGLAVTYTVTSGPATISGSTINYTGTGTVVIAADQAGNANYTAASTVSDIVSTTSGTQTVNVTFTTSGTLGYIYVLTTGQPNLDFTYVSGGTCTIGTFYSANNMCSVNYTFAPRAPGQRMGAVQLVANNGTTALGTSLLAGTGTGAAAAFPGDTSTYTLGSGFTYPAGVAVDAAGNVYLADTYRGVKEIVAAGGSIPASPAIRSLGSGFANPYDVAVDGAGNVYVADSGNGAVKEILAVAGTIPATPAIRTLLNGNNLNPTSLAVDAAGNVYFADTVNNAVKEIVAVGGSIPASNVTVKTLGSGFNQPRGVAVDASGNVYVADTNNNAVKEILAVAGSIPASNPTINTLVGGYSSGLSGPFDVAVDAAGNVYVTDHNNSAVKEIVAVGGSVPSNPTILTLGSGLGPAYGLTVDGAGNVYVADFFNNAVKQIPLSLPPVLSLPDTVEGATSAAQTLQIENIGNANLIVSALAISPSNFYNTGTTCNIGALIAQSGFCYVGASFTPPSIGSFSGAFNVTDNSLSTSGTTQSISLIGNGTAGTTPQTITFPQPTTPATPGTATLTATSSSGLAVTYSITSGPATVSGSTVTYTGAGTVVIAANQAGNATYAAAATVSNTVSVLVEYVWLVNANSTISRLNTSGSGLTNSGTAAGASTRGGIAFDASGNTWSVARASNVLSFTNNSGSGSTTYTGGGLNTPVSLAVDGAGYIWVANSGTNSISAFNNAGTAQSPATTGYSGTSQINGGATTGAFATPSAVVLDVTGGVWVTNKTGNSITHIFGLAAPVTTPLSTAITNSTLGTEP